MIHTFEEIYAWLNNEPLRPRKVAVLTTCTSIKAKASAPAELLYQGHQQRYLMEGVNYYRKAKGEDSIDVFIISAKYGVVKGSDVLEPYDHSFLGTSKNALRERARALSIPANAAHFLSAEADLRLVLLGNEYFDACQFQWEEIPYHGDRHTIILCSHEKAATIPDQLRTRIYPIGLGVAEAKKYRGALANLKGNLAARLLRCVANPITDSLASAP